MDNSQRALEEFGSSVGAFLKGLAASQTEPVGASEDFVIDKLLNPRKVQFGKEIRRATLYTELTVGGKSLSFEAYGARSCSTLELTAKAARGTQVFNLACDLTYFAADDTPLGPVKIVQDPRIQMKGWIFLRRNRDGEFQLPGLSFFNQHLVFHVGDQYFYYPSAWQVVSAILEWPPEYYQYHHLEEDTPIFDFVTGEPNVARKGISTISIEDELSPDEEKRIRADFARECAAITELPASKLSPIDKTPAQHDINVPQSSSAKKRRGKQE